MNENAKKAVDQIYSRAEDAAVSVRDKASDLGQSVKERASELGQNVKERASELGQNVSNKASELGHAVSDKASELGHAVSDKANAAVHSVGGKITGLADSLRENAPAAVAPYAKRAAQRLATAGSYLEQESLREMMGDLGRVMQRHPVATMLSGVALGFVLARKLGK